MSLELLRPSATILQWPMSFEVLTLHIDPEEIPKDATVGLVVTRLVTIGGRFIGWQPDFDGDPAVAQFWFATPQERAQFLDDAPKISGVTVADTPRSSHSG